jgi:anti-sigma factor RsiW
MSSFGYGCPTGETLSAYLDGEVKAPRQIAEHLDGCPACRLVLARLARVRERLASDPLPDVVPPPLPEIRPRPVPLWKRRIALPLPAAAGAILAILGLGFALIATVGRAPLSWMSIRRAPTGATELIVAAPVEDLEQLLGSLDRSSQGPQLVIHLPADSRLMMTGEPQLVREADYSRGRRW